MEHLATVATRNSDLRLHADWVPRFAARLEYFVHTDGDTDRPVENTRALGFPSTMGHRSNLFFSLQLHICASSDCVFHRSDYGCGNNPFFQRAKYHRRPCLRSATNL